jgi:GT2 family glycosyltransferase
MLVSVIIVNWNSKAFVEKCLASLNNCSLPFEREIIVVDGASFDGCGEMLAEKFPAVQFVQLKENVGFGLANNAGFKKSRGNYIWLLNPDTEVIGEAAALMLSVLQSRPDAGIVGPKLLNSDGSLQTSCVQALPTPMNQSFDSEFLRKIFPNSSLWGTTALRSREKTVDVEAIPGACMVLRRETFEKIGLFDSRFFMYGEDMDLCIKVRKLGLKVIFVREAEVIHHGGGSSRQQFSKFSTVLMRVAVTTYLRIHFGQLDAIFYRISMTVSALVRLTALGLLYLVPTRGKSSSKSLSIKKWVAILKWCVGGEKWAREYAWKR